ncbi:hypothetical protein [Tanticharoenia sakaeratensis]|uniref:Uncharacterized protein n=1 Tax=Tanticharoenia sakaeratensis NBRC 103193 TaxID=1231623 RepID=A0A0D6MJ63_9PROT|nr:hypothetical protein [Tanticharoenia sakaeratensis]GAN53699.1 hypothetical protein Tasa_010_246 [Tanticharoenia sakaeratensis NBRC 103193]GBQ17157.1 hypothetical protein AA103193_0241 [Tanticharoenia sakaeratensis NBRC 103193]
MNEAPLWTLLAGWPLLAACVLALVPTAHRRASAATLATTGLAATLVLVWRMPADAVAKAACVGLGAALALHWTLGHGASARARVLPVFASAGILGLLACGADLAISAGLLGAQAVCVAAVGLSARRRARPGWEALLSDLSGAVLLLVSSGAPAASFAPVCASLGFGMLGGLGPRPRGEERDDESEASLARALLGVGAVIALGRSTMLISTDIVLGLGVLTVWLAAVSPVPRGVRIQIALAAMAAVLPHGAWAAGVSCLLALGLGAANWMPNRLASANMVPWPGFVAALWVIDACWRQPGPGTLIAALLLAGLVLAALRRGVAPVRADAMTIGLMMASLGAAVVLEQAG